MALLVLLLLLVSGLRVCLKDPIIYYKLHRYDGQMLYLQAGRYGIYCFLMASFIVGVISLLLSNSWGGFCLCQASKVCVPSFSTDFLPYLGKKAELVGLFKEGKGQLGVFTLLASVLTLLMPYVWSVLSINYVMHSINAENEEQTKAYILRETVSHSPLSTALVEAFARKIEVMISMDDRKVYVGYIKSVGKPTEVVGVDEEIELLPSVSGYRDKDTLKVIYTTEYSVETKIKPMYFKQENIVSVSLFSQEIRDAFESAATDKGKEADDFQGKLYGFLKKLTEFMKDS